MTDPDKKPIKKLQSKSSLEQSLNMMSPPQQAPITIYPGPSASLASLCKADLEIAQRLENLRKSQTDKLPTEEEMALRLAHLKGLPTDHYTKGASNAVYHKPDTRSQTKKADDLLSQVMEEVAIDARAPKPDEELEARLARLRGEELPSDAPQGAMALPPAVYHPSTSASVDPNLSEVMDDMSMDEIEAIMKAAEEEAKASAKKSLGELQADPELAEAVAEASKKREKKGSKKKRKGSGVDDASEDERRSKSFDSDELDVEGGKAIDAVTEQEEVQRIINMYTKRAELKKEKKRRKKEAAAAEGGAGAVGGDDSDSDIEITSDSDLTSESEKDSLSDELSD